MICPFCGGELPDNSTECFICGEMIMKQVPEDALGKGITIISNNQNSGENPQTSGMPYSYGTAVNNSHAVDYDYSGRSSKNNSKMILLLSAAALILVAVIACVKFGLFENKDGVYSVQNLDEVFQKILTSQGLDADLESVNLETSITINGKECKFRAAVYYDGQVIGEEEHIGTVEFRGTKGIFEWEDKSGMGVAEYNRKDKSLTFPVEGSDAELYGMDSLVFVRENQ